MNQHLRRLILLALAFGVVAGLLLVALARQEAPVTGNTVVHLGDKIVVPRSPTPLCESLVDADKGAAVLHLFVDGLDTGVSALKCENGGSPSVTFVLRRVRPEGVPVAIEEAAWNAMLGHPLRDLGGTRQLNVDIRRVADAANTRLAPAGTTLTLAIFYWWAPVAVVLVFFVWGLTIYLSVNSALIRDAAPEGTALSRRTYSLAKTQFAWWFAIIFASLAFLWLVTGEVPALSPQALALLGMSGVTTGLAVAVSPDKLASNGQEGVFFHDLISDAQGVTIHRFQMVVITAALGLVFLYEVVMRLTMPTFDVSLLTMMGLSSAAYIGLKIPEQASAPPNADPKAGYGAAGSSVLPPVIRPQSPAAPAQSPMP